MSQVPFSIGIQPSDPKKVDVKEFEEQIRQHAANLKIEVKNGVHPMYSLSNCRDTDTDCTCDIDD